MSMRLILTLNCLTSTGFVIFSCVLSTYVYGFSWNKSWCGLPLYCSVDTSILFSDLCFMWWVSLFNNGGGEQYIKKCKSKDTKMTIVLLCLFVLY